MIYTYSGILFSLKKEGSSDTCYNMNFENISLVENKFVTKGQMLYDFIYIHRALKFRDRKQMKAARSSGQGAMSSYCFIDGISVGEDGKCSVDRYGDGCTPKNDLNGKFSIMYIFYYNKQKFKTRTTHGFQPKSCGFTKRIPALETVAGVAVLKWCISKRSLIEGVRTTRSLLARVSTCNEQHAVTRDHCHWEEDTNSPSGQWNFP
jgi:hypothetical protein